MLQGKSDRHEIKYPTGRKEVWVVPGSSEWRRLRRVGGGGGRVREEGGEEKEEGEADEDSYGEPEEEVSSHGGWRGSGESNCLEGLPAYLEMLLCAGQPLGCGGRGY